MNLKLKYQKYRFRRGLFGRIILQVSHGRKALTGSGARKPNPLGLGSSLSILWS